VQHLQVTAAPLKVVGQLDLTPPPSQPSPAAG
jgi:hypothetical protein